MSSELQGATILVIDDDINLCQMLEITLAIEGAFVYTATDGKEGLQKFFAHRPSLIILDILMPNMSGWEVCRQIRLMADTPIIMLTTLNRDEEIIRGLDFGADDFIHKPFNAAVLLARVRAMLRRANLAASEKKPSAGYSDEHLVIDLEKREVRVLGEPVKLTATEFQLLTYLLQNANHVRTYQQILENVWGWEYYDNVDYVHVYISHLRRKIEPDTRNPRYLLTDHGIGYRFSVSQ